MLINLIPSMGKRLIEKRQVYTTPIRIPTPILVLNARGFRKSWWPWIVSLKARLAGC